MNTKIYVARNKCGYLQAFNYRPQRGTEVWYSERYGCFAIDERMFPELRWVDEPMEVTLIKKK